MSRILFSIYYITYITCLIFLFSRNTALTPSEMVLVTLRFLATGSILQIIGDFNGIDKSTVSRTVTKVLRCIAQLRNQFINMPSTEEEFQKVKQGFYSISRFPKCIGAVDCTHIRIQSPGGNNAEIFRNRKGFFSFNVQVICDHNLNIQDIVCRWPGSTHDSTIFNNSRIRARFENGEFGDSLLLGDGGYAVRNYLITPLRNPVTPAEHLFNESQIRTRNPIERLFGVLKRRFPILSLGIRIDVRKVEAIVVACAVLHNIARQVGEPELEGDEDVEGAIQFANVINVDVADAQAGLNANNITRYNLIRQYFEGLL